ncbi:hypothetical protein [Paraglaciecola sp.]|uniref:hypothetical protein n=1 Tax=Paraglaciecola sp. TaxID=1920173 RepID=UPI003EF3E519
MKKLLLSAVFCCLTTSVLAKTFTTQGNGVRTLITANVGGQGVLYTGELDGAVAQYSTDGKLIWQTKTDNKAVLFELNAVDLNGDNNDDLLAASGDGSIYAWNAKGQKMWQFTPNHKVRFNEIAVAQVGGRTRIYAGGNDFNLYELSVTGQLLSTTTIDGTVRKIEAGHFIEKDKASLLIYTYAHDKFRWQFLGFMDPASKKIISKIAWNDRKMHSLRNSVMVTDLKIADLDQDGLDDLLFFAGGKAAEKASGTFAAYNGQFEQLASFNISGKDKQRYAHVYGESLLPIRNQVMFQFGGITYIVDNKGKLIEKIGKKLSGLIFNGFALEPKTKQLFAAGQVGGGNTLYSFDLNKSDWYQTKHKLQGRLADVESNINNLYQQALDFELPSYQTKSDKPWFMITSATPNKQVQKLDGAQLKTAIQTNWKENWDRTTLAKNIGEIALKKDKRGKYQLTRKEIVGMAKDFEKKGQPFVVWAGHVTDPFYMSIDTLEAILAAAPNTAHGFIYAEMYDPKDPRVIHFIEEYVPRLAAAMRKQGKAKLYFRYKNVFWAATSHMQPWKDLFFSGKYSDILVPASEDTSSRTQDLNLTGRVGMFAGGYVDDFAMRLVDDNPTSWRPYTPGGQRSISPYLRQGVMMAAYGARMGIIFQNKYAEKPGLNILYALMKSGVLPVVEKQNIQSIGSWMLNQDINKGLIHSIDNHHQLNHYKTDDEDALMSVAQMHWAGTSLPAHDYSSAALGVDYRWLNYIPELPHGMVPIAPVDTHKQLDKNKMPYFVGDGKYGLLDGKKIPAAEFSTLMQNTLKQGANQLPILVKGAAWSVIKLDESHSRIILLDQGYTDPQDRQVTIQYQGIKPKWVKDILSKQIIAVNNSQSSLVVPAGSLRFIDVEY